MSELYYVIFGSTAGIIAGLLPGVGVLTSLILLFPFLLEATTLQLMLFYMSLAAMVQFTGTVPSIFLGIPGETNNTPTVIEGIKFTRRKRNDLAVGICAIGSVVGSIVSVLILYGITYFILEVFSVAISSRFKLVVFTIIFVILLYVYNNKNILVNALLFAFGFLLSMVGESPISSDFRLTFSSMDLTQGLGIVPVITGLLVLPNILKIYNNKNSSTVINNITILSPIILFSKHIFSSIRGSFIGFIAGLVPGLSTVLSTNLSYAVESTLHRRSPSKKIIACETANNSGQFASLLPLLLFGIPITGSEIFLYNLLVKSGWDTNQFQYLDSNIVNIFENILPWFILVNIIGFLVSWPLAKYAMLMFKISQKYIVIFIIALLFCVNFYVGLYEYRLISYIIQFLIFSIVGILLRKYNVTPVIFSFLLGNEIESVFYRELLLLN